MLFFALLAVLALAAALPPWFRTWPERMRVAMALALFLVGADHWLNPERYLPMMPPWIPLHLELVLFTGAAEIAGGFGLLIGEVRRLAGVMLAIYFVAVFPANIHNALHGLAVDGLPQAAWYYWARLPFQPLAIWWGLYAAEVIRWPSASSFRRRVRAPSAEPPEACDTSRRPAPARSRRSPV
jgi:uncharacterized membrane protein